MRINYEFCSKIWDRIHLRAIKQKERDSRWMFNLTSVTVLVGSPVRRDSYFTDQPVQPEQRTYEVEPSASSRASCRIICPEVEAIRLYPYKDAYRSQRSLEVIARDGVLERKAQSVCVYTWSPSFQETARNQLPPPYKRRRH